MLCPLKKNQKTSIQYGDEITFGTCNEKLCEWWVKKMERKTYTEKEIEESEKFTHTELKKIKNTNLYENYIEISGCAVKLIAEK